MSKSKRIKQILTAPLNRTEVETLVNDIALTVNNQRLLTGEMDTKILAIRDEYAAALSLCEEGISIGTERLKLWAIANPSEFASAKSIRFAAGTIGFRIGMPKLKTILKTNWDRVLGALRVFRLGIYIRTTEEINKEQIIADIGSGTLSVAELRTVGAEVVQEESFYVDPKLEEVKTRQVAK